MLSWAGEALAADGRSLGNIRQGVTLEVMGEGWSGGPLSPVMKSNRKSTDSIAYSTLGEYLDWLAAKGLSTNIASFVGATTVRINVLGYENRPPSQEELGQMQQLVKQAMQEGAMGVGSSLVYAPAFYAKTDELIALCQAAAPYGGMYISHIRSEGDAFLEALEELISIAQNADIAAEVYHLKAAGTANWPKMDSAIARIERARSEGMRITANMYTYTAGSTGIDATVPPWAQEGGSKVWIPRLKEPEFRKKILEEMRAPVNNWENFLKLAGSPDRIILLGFDQDSLQHLKGKTLAEIASTRRISPEECILDLLYENGEDISSVFFMMSEENVKKQIALPWMSFGSDAASMAPEGAFLSRQTHPRAYGTFARLLGKYVRDEQVISLEEAIRRLTTLPATNLKLQNRGAVKQGYYADLVILNPDIMNDKATYTEPHQLAEGVLHVFVNGTQVLRNGMPTEARPGRVLRGPGWQK
jgi:N-acyl-D-amino-acid deacylase